MIRKDVMKRAKQLSKASGISADSIYCWLMDIGKAEEKNPCSYDFYAAPGIVSDAKRPDTFRIVKMNYHRTSLPAGYYGPDYEDMILARQEAFLD